MKNRKGFTIVELLVVIVIIGILAIIAVPLVTRYLEKGKQKYYDSLNDELIVLAKTYYTDNKKELPKGQIYYKTLTLEELKKENYIINDVVDINKNNCEQSYITVEKVDSNYIYNACLICDNKLVSGGDCPFEGKKDETIPTCSVTINNYQLGDWTKDNVSITINGSDASGIGYFKINGKKVLSNAGNSATTNITSKGNYTVNVYDKAGNAGSCSVGQINIDKEKPTCSMKVISETNKTKLIEIEGKDNISGIDSLKIDNNLLTNSNNKATYEVNDNGKYIGTVFDKAGNSNTCEITITGLDKEKPTINNLITTLQSNGTSNKITATMTDNIGVKYYALTTTTTVPTTWTEITSALSYNYSATVSSTGTYYIWVKDEADNYNYKSIYVDLSKPTVGTIAKSCSTSSCVLSSTITDNAGVKYVALTTSSTVPTSWTAITKTTSYSYSTTVSATGTYYVWAKDETGNYNYKTVSVSSSYSCPSGGSISGTTCSYTITMSCPAQSSYTNVTYSGATMYCRQAITNSSCGCPSGYKYSLTDCKNFGYAWPKYCYSQSNLGVCVRVNICYNNYTSASCSAGTITSTSLSGGTGYGTCSYGASLKFN